MNINVTHNPIQHAAAERSKSRLPTKRNAHTQHPEPLRITHLIPLAFDTKRESRTFAKDCVRF